MANHVDIIYGFGFNPPLIEREKLAAFIINHKTVIEEKHIENEMELLDAANRKFDTCEDTDDIRYDYDDILCDTTGQAGMYAIVANVIHRETQIRVRYEPGDGEDGSEETIMFAECLPWQLNAFERDLTSEENLSKILAKYRDELTSEPEQYPIECKRVESWG